jgi:hypothetical protein
MFLMRKINEIFQNILTGFYRSTNRRIGVDIYLAFKDLFIFLVNWLSDE